MNLIEALKRIVEVSTKGIKDLAKEELANNKKKELLDNTIREYIIKGEELIGCNFLVKLAIRKLVLPYIDEFTQLIYDLLKAKVEEL